MNLFHLNFPYDCFACPSMGKCAIRNIWITGTGAHQFSDAMILRIQSPLKDIRVVFFTMSLPLGSHKNVTMWKVTTFLLVWLCSSQRIMGRPMLPCVTVKIVIKAMRALSQIGQWSDFVGAVKTRRRSPSD